MAELAGHGPSFAYLGIATELVDAVLARAKVTLPRHLEVSPVTPAITAVRMTGAAHRAELPLLVLGPSLGTSAATLWSACAAPPRRRTSTSWPGTCPGHGHNRSVPDEPFTMAELAAGVLAVVDDVQAQRGDLGAPFSYAGDSVGGAVGLQLLLDAPDRVDAAGAALHRRPDRRRRRVGRPDRPGHRVRARRSWWRRRRSAGSGPASWTASPTTASALLHALQRHRRRSATSRSAGRWRVRRARPARRDRARRCWPWPVRTTPSRPPTRSRRSRRAYAAARWSSSPTSRTSRPAEAPDEVAALIRRALPRHRRDPIGPGRLSPG